MFLYVQTLKNDVRVSISLNPFSSLFSAPSFSSLIPFGHKSFALLENKIGAKVVFLFSFRPVCGTVDNVIVNWLVGYGRQGSVNWCNRKG